jgi:hypothetical protein
MLLSAHYIGTVTAVMVPGTCLCRFCFTEIDRSLARNRISYEAFVDKPVHSLVKNNHDKTGFEVNSDLDPRSFLILTARKKNYSPN